MASAIAAKPKLDLTLYLVTDSTPAILGDKSIYDVVESALKGGVTVVQYREKNADTAIMIETAGRLHEITQKYNVPLLINDRVDVCLAVGAEGVHVGQDDMTLNLAKRSLPPDAIIGVTASSTKEANAAVHDGADYLGIGTIFATSTKPKAKSIIGTRGAQAILGHSHTGNAHAVPCVAIGGINMENVARVLHQSTFLKNRLNGVAVVSAIMAAPSPESAAAALRAEIQGSSSKFYTAVPPGQKLTTSSPQLLSVVPDMVKKHFSSSVLCHNMTNTVVQNFAANVCLATGSSPIMSMNAEEAPELAELGGALVVNMGTVTPEIMDVYLAGVSAYNQAGNPVLFDPVGGGATQVRRNAIKTLMAGGFFDVIKGNEGEITAVMGNAQAQQRGVDSGPSTSTLEQKAAMAKTLAQREGCIVLMTGSTDLLSDGVRTVAISNGSHWLGKITGSGCALGAVVAGYVATHREDKFHAALAGILHYEVAAEKAADDEVCKGPGTFVPLFLDQLHAIGATAAEGGPTWLDTRAKLSWM